jgi:putative membrane protein
MNKFVQNISLAAMSLAVGTQAAWADATASAPAVSGGVANFQGPGWNGYGPGPWMMGGGWAGPQMMGYGGGGWMMMLFGSIIMVALLVFLVRVIAGHGCPYHRRYPQAPMQPGNNSAGLHALDARYARGEINREEYLQKKSDILGA